MTQLTRWGGATALAALLGSTGVAQAITAEELWKNWVDQYTSMGQTIEAGGTTKDGDTLVITDAKISMTGAEGGYEVVIPEIRLEETGDDTVVVTMSESFGGTLTQPGTPAEGETPATEPTTVDIAFAQSGLTLTAAGSAEDTTYTMAGDSIDLTLSEPGASNKEAGMTAKVGLTGLSGDNRIVVDGGRTLDSTFGAESVTFSLVGTDPTDGTAINASGKMGGVSGKSSMTMPEGVNMEQMDAALNAGLKMSADATFGAGEFSLEANDGAAPVTITSTSAGGDFMFTMSKDALDYSVNGGKTELAMTTAQLPFPVNASVAETAFRLAMPMGKSDTPAPYAAVLRIVDLAVSEELWGTFDPTGQLPHDPATLAIDLSGTAKLTADLFNPETASAGAAPGTVESLDINELHAKVAGAELTGKGAMTFDNSAGIPAPLGSIDLTLTGGFGLMDKLAAMGFIPADQVAGFKMMAGLFAKPVGEDELESKIEFKEGGAIFANGQQLQ